jgi:DNA polymerase-3 subunit alpha (Gram-positive type)
MHNTTDKKRAFSDVFGEVTMDGKLFDAFREALVTQFLYNKISKHVEIHMELPEVVQMNRIYSLEKALCSHFNAGVKVIPCFSIKNDNKDIPKICRENFIEVIAGKSAHFRYLLENAIFEVEDQKLNIHLKTGGSMILQSGNCNKVLEDYIRTCFRKEIKVCFIDPPLDEKERERYFKEKSSIEQKAIKKIVCYPAGEGRKGRSRASVNTASYRVNGKGKSTDPDIVYGKPFNEETVPISEVSIDSGRVAVKGKVIYIETRLLNSGKTLFCFDLTDLTHSITVKCFASEKQLAALTDNVKEGEWLRVLGDAQFDAFSRELALMAKSIMKIHVIEKMDNAEEKRVELHLHTQMSQMDAVTTVKDLIERAAKWGHPAVAITDHGVVQAYPDAYEAAKKKGIKIIYGVEIYLLGEDRFDEKGKTDYKNIDTYHAILLARNQKGLKNLYRLISESHMEYFYKRPRVPRHVLERYRDGLILGSACEAGEVYRAILNKWSDDKILEVADYYDYLEIQPLDNNRFLMEAGEVSGYDELKEINVKIVKLGEKLKKPVVATCDVHFLDPEDEVFRRILQAGQGYSDADRQAPLYFRTTDEMLEEFSYLGKETAFEVVVNNTRLIAETIEEVKPIPEGTFPPFIDGSEEEVRNISEKRAAELYGNPLPETVRLRLDKELNSIIKNGFSVMYVIARKLVAKSLQDGYLVGSRGSVGSSFVAYLTGITEVNSLPPHYRCEKCLYSGFFEKSGASGCGFDLPDKQCPNCGELLLKDGYDIPFETFLGFDGDKEPDIDLNFSGQYQPNAHKYTEELFGEGHVFRAGTIATVADKTAFGFVKGYLNDKGLTATNAEIKRLVSGCTGVKRTTGQHPGGVMIVPHDKEIYDFTPIQRPADDTNSSTITTHFDYHSISGRILKLDILGHDDPTVIRMLQDITGVDPKDIPIGEKKTMGLFVGTEPLNVTPEDIGSEVGTFGIPEFGTKFVRQMLVDTKPTTFAELIRISGLSHGTDVWTNNAQDLVRNKVATLAEVITTRDDIMLYLINNGLDPLTSFKIMEDVRKGKGLTPDYEDLMKKAGIPGWYIESCKKIKYMFPKAHAAAYVMMAFRIAWFKVYYPEAFYATYFTVRADVFDADIISKGRDKIIYTLRELEKKGNKATQKEKNLITILEVANEMYARGIKCLPVDLYKSHPSKFQITKEGLLPPLTALQGLGAAAAANIAAAREKDAFLSVDDIKIRAGVSKSVIEILENHGCLDGMDKSNQLCFF